MAWRLLPFAGRPLTGRDVFIMIAAFFAVMLAANGVFVWLALKSYPGVETPSAYREGLEYNRLLDQARDVEALGWQVDVDYQASTAERVRIVVRAATESGRPLVGRTVIVGLRRPVHDRADRRYVGQERAAGIYQTDADLPGAGVWVAEIRILRDDGPDFVTSRRLMVSR